MFTKITENGEIVYNNDTEMYIVYDETYSNVIYETNDIDYAYWQYNRYLEYLDGTPISERIKRCMSELVAI